MGGSIPMPAEYVYGLLALLMIPLPFLCAFAIRVVAGPRESIWSKGLKVFGLGLLVLLAVAMGGRIRSPLVGVPVLLAAVFTPVAGFKVIAETTWLRAVAGVLMSLVLYAVAIGGLSLAFGWWRPDFLR